MRQIRFFVTLALLSIVPSLGALAQNQQRPVVIRGGLLIDGTGAAPVPNSVIVVSNGRIQAVGREGTVTIPANATIIEAGGKTVIPGLVDSHVHLRNYHIQDYLYWGVTTVGDLGNSPGWLVAYRDAVEQGRATGSYILVGGQRFNAPLRSEFNNPLDAFMTGNAGNAFITDAASAGKAVLEVKKIGQDAIKMRDRLTPVMMKTIIDLAHKQGLPVFAHFDSANIRQGQPLLGTDEIVDTGLDVQVHLFGLIKATAPPAVIDRIRKGGPVQGWDQLDTNKFAPIIQKMVANKMFLNPTIAAQFERASKYLPEFDRINTDYVNSPMALGLPKAVRDRYARWLKPGPEQNNAQLPEGYKRAGLFIKQFADAGGKLIAGTDSDAGRLGTSGITLHQEMVTRPGLLQEGFANPALHVPMIDEISPELISTNQKNASQLTIKGTNFTKNNLVLINDQLVRGTLQGEDELRVPIPSSVSKAAGVYPLVVVQPGSAGGVSNTFYLMVTTKTGN